MTSIKVDLFLREFHDSLRAVRISGREAREGQVLFNCLLFYNPRLAEKLRGGEYDPFYLHKVTPKR